MHTSQNPTLCLDFQQIYPDGLQSQPSLCDLMNKVAAEIPNRWQDIAVQLKLSVEWIQCVEYNNPRNPNGCYMQVFAAWEKKEDKTLPYTWESLLKILATPAVACKHLEQSIRASIQPGATTMTPADSQHCSHSPPQNFGQQSHCGNNEWFEKAWQVLVNTDNKQNISITSLPLPHSFLADASAVSHNSRSLGRQAQHLFTSDV